MITSTLVKDLIERVKPSIAEIWVPTDQGWEKNGSGFAISADGLLATCHHVINGWPQYAVSFDRGTRHEARLEVSRPGYDLALLKTQAATRPLALGSLDQVDVGKEVLWCGFPIYSWLLSFHKGMISYIGDIPTPGGISLKGLQLDGTINRGNSGGPIIDPGDGLVVGVLTSSMGGLDEALREAFRAARATNLAMVFKAGDTEFNPTEMLIEVVRDMERLVQLGVGYGISADYLEAMRREL